MDRFISLEELTNCLGGEADGTFNEMDINHDGTISMDEWQDFFKKVKKEKGTKYMEFIIAYFKRSLVVQSVIGQTIAELSEIQKLSK